MRRGSRSLIAFGRRIWGRGLSVGGCRRRGCRGDLGCILLDGVVDWRVGGLTVGVVGAVVECGVGGGGEIGGCFGNGEGLPLSDV